MAPKASPKKSPAKSPAKAPAKAAAKAPAAKAAKTEPLARYSPQLLWECVKKDSSFLRKSPTPNMPWMSACVNNLTGVNSFKFSGLSGGKILGLNPVKNGSKESIVLTTCHPKLSRCARPGAMSLNTGIPKQTKKGLAALDAAISGKFYRKDLLDIVKAKFAKIQTSFKKKKLTIKSRRATK